MPDTNIQAPQWLSQMETILDTTAQKRVEQQLRKANSLLEDHQWEIEADLALASRVQESLAPRSLVWNDLSIDGYYSPARTIGGDFGVVLPQSHDVLSIVVCDVTGHGIGSALLANRIYSETLHELERGSGPGSLLRHVHEFVHTRIGSDGFYFTMAAGRFSRRGRRLTFASGGQPPATLVSKTRLSVPRIPEWHTRLPSGDRSVRGRGRNRR